MSITCDGCGLSYAGGRGGKGVFAQPRRLPDPRYLRCWRCPALPPPARTRCSTARTRRPSPRRRASSCAARLLRPTSSRTSPSRWSPACGRRATNRAGRTPPATCSTSSSTTAFSSVKGSPQWRTVTGGSAHLRRRWSPRSAPSGAGEPRVTAVARTMTASTCVDVDGDRHHADARRRRHARRPGARAARRRDRRREARARRDQVLRNETWLHRDSSVLPDAPQAARRWNYRMDGCDASARRHGSATG